MVKVCSKHEKNVAEGTAMVQIVNKNECYICQNEKLKPLKEIRLEEAIYIKEMF